MSSVEQRKMAAEDLRQWFLAFVAAGFTEEQAFALVCASYGRSVFGGPPPEFLEMATKLSRR